MKGWQLHRKVNDLSGKINDAACGGGVRLDFESFSETEKLLFGKADEVDEEYRRTHDDVFLEKNADLLVKRYEVIFRRLNELYCELAPTLIAWDRTDDYEVFEFYFKLHMMFFHQDLGEQLRKVRDWPEKKRLAFASSLREANERCQKSKESKT